MLSINTNLSSLIAQNSLQKSTNLLNQAVERMTTGYKINGAKDNAANYSISTNMSTKINSYMVAEDNAAMGLDMVTTASSTLDLVSDHVQRIRDLCEQAANGTYGEESLKAIQAEIDSRQQEIDRIISQAEYNGIKFLEGEASSGVTGSFIAPVTQLTEEQAIAEGYTIIRTADELQAMEDDLSGKYILMNDIDLAGYNWDPVIYFEGELNGNGYEIKNLTLNKPLEDNLALFGSLGENVIIKNLGIINANIKGNDILGILAGSSSGYNSETIQNVYVQGTIVGNDSIGGLLGDVSHALSGLIENCYADVNITANNNVGGLIGFGCDGTPSIKNSFVKGSVKGNDYVGGISGHNYGYCDTIENVYSSCLVQGNSNTGAIMGDRTSSNYTNVYWDTQKCAVPQAVGTGTHYTDIVGVSTAELRALIDNGTLPSVNIPPKSDKTINLQIGTMGDSNSRISFVSSVALEALSITVSDSDTARGYLTTIDDYLAKISAKQVEYGAVTNRLESALEEISTQYENLVSSRSTLRDADIAKESSTYIQQQILQQASATLLATANQSPSIALQLI